MPGTIRSGTIGTLPHLRDTAAQRRRDGAPRSDVDLKTAGLDVQLCCLPRGTEWSDDFGGQLTYAEAGEEEPLQARLSRAGAAGTTQSRARTQVFDAACNTLNIVLRAEPGTFKFVKCKHTPAPPAGLVLGRSPWGAHLALRDRREQPRAGTALRLQLHLPP